MNTLVWLDAILFVLPCWHCLMQTKENWWQKFCISLSQLTSLSPSVACLPDSPLRHKLEPSLHSCLLVLLDPLSSPHTWAIAGHGTAKGPCYQQLAQPLGMVPGEQEHCHNPNYISHKPLPFIGSFSSEGLWSGKWLRSIAQSLFQKLCNTPKHWRRKY